MTTTIIEAIAHEETRLARLDDERKTILENIRKLRAQLASYDVNRLGILTHIGIQLTHPLA